VVFGERKMGNMQFAPPGAFIANGTVYDFCYGLKQAQAIEPPTPLWMQQLNLAFLGLTIALSLVNSILWYIYRKLPRLEKARNFWITKGFEIAVIIMSCAILLRNGVVDPVTGIPTQSCLTTVGLYLSSLALIADMYFLRLVIAVGTSRRASLVRVFSTIDRADDNGSVDDASSVSTKRTTVFDYLAGVTHVMLGMQPAQRKVVNSETSKSSETRQWQKTQLTRMSDSLKPRALAIMTTIVFFPFIIPFLILLGTVDVYKGGCTGCRLYWEFTIAYLVIFNPYAGLGFRLQAMLFSEKDEYGVNKELLISLSGAALTVPLGLILLIFDPNLADYNNIFLFEWWIWISGVWPMIVWTSVQIVLGIREERRRHQISMSKGFSVSEETVQMKAALDNPDFLDIAERQYVMENIRFLQDLLVYKQLFYEKSPSWRKSKTRLLLETYIEEGSIMEINISFSCRQQIKSNISKDQYSSDVFDEAETEVEGMLVNGAWKDYRIIGKGSAIVAKT
jgi:hypothetical protein